MKKIIGKLILTSLLFLFVNNAEASVRYVRIDGGNGTQCDGLTDHALSGASGTNCALNSPHWVLPSAGNSTSRQAIAGDTVVIESGSYRIGCQNASNCKDSNVNLTASACSASTSGECYMGPIPSGTISNVTKVYGCTINGCPNVASIPELWGAGANSRIIDLRNKSYVQLRDLILTDHATCGQGSAYDCPRSGDPSGLSARNGITMDGASNIQITNVNIHGLYHCGVIAPFSQNITYDGDTLGASKVDFNAVCGIDMGGSACLNSSICGVSNGNYMKFLGNNPNQMMSISWNGCVENYNSPGTAANLGCYNGNNGGYGDAFGTGGTSGNWTFNYFRAVHNTSDGIDLRYCYDTGCTVDIRNSHIGGNAGNQVKAAGTLVFYNNLVEDDCDFFDGKAYRSSGMASCNSLGDAFFFGFQNSGITKKVYGNTIINVKGNVFGDACDYSGSGCQSSNTLDIKNNIIHSTGKWSGIGGGAPGYMYTGASNDTSCGICSGATITQTDNIIYGFSTNPSGTGNIYTNPLLSGVFDGSTNAAQLSSTSPARDTASESASGQPTTDFNAFSRGASYDKGFLEFGSSYSGSSPVCGNNSKEGSEICDGTDLTPYTSGTGCVSLGYTSGTLGCSAGCGSYNTSGCVTNLCGNGNIDGSEPCDGANLNSQTCASQGYSAFGGSLSCSSCALVTSGCVPITCGDGHTEGTEGCDDGNTSNSDGCSSICQSEIAGYEKYLLYTEADPSSNLTVETHKSTMVNLTHTTDTNLRYDYGASYFQNFTHKFKVSITSCTDDGHFEDGGATMWALTSTARANSYVMETAGDGLSISLGCLSSSARYTWKLYSAEGVTALDSFDDSAPSLIRYIKVVRAGTNVTASFYSDPNYSVLIRTLSVTAPATAYRYIYTTTAYNDGVSGTTFSGSVENMNLAAAPTDPPPPPPTGVGGCQAQGITGSGIQLK